MIRIRFAGRRDETPSQPDASGSPKRRSALRSGDIIGKTCGIVNRIPKQSKRKTRHSEGRSPVGIPWTGVPIRTPENPGDCHVGAMPLLAMTWIIRWCIKSDHQVQKEKAHHPVCFSFWRNLAGTSLRAGNISKGLRDIHPDVPFSFFGFTAPSEAFHRRSGRSPEWNEE